MIVYKITNRINGKIYIGQTVGKLEVRWKEHQRSKDNAIFHKAVHKYGAENFTVEQIDIATSFDELDAKEKYWIAFYDSRRTGYNMTDGGSSGAVHIKRSDATKKRIAEAIFGEKHWHATKVMNVETREVFATVSEAARKYGTSKSNISGCCNGRKHYNTCKGYHWKYVISDD